MQQSNSSCLNCNPMKSIYDIYRSTYLNMITILILSEFNFETTRHPQNVKEFLSKIHKYIR